MKYLHGSRDWFRDVARAMNEWQIQGQRHACDADAGNVRDAALQHIRDAIEASRFIYSLQDDYDGEGSKGYRKSTWERATGFVMDLASEAFQEFQVVIDAPDIGPGPNGSIDLHWKTEKYELLLKVPEDPLEPVAFYGDDYGRARIKGEMQLSAADVALIVWLANQNR